MRIRLRGGPLGDFYLESTSPDVPIPQGFKAEAQVAFFAIGDDGQERENSAEEWRFVEPTEEGSDAYDVSFSLSSPPKPKPDTGSIGEPGRGFGEAALLGAGVQIAIPQLYTAPDEAESGIAAKN
jgi:hypothetical protein